MDACGSRQGSGCRLTTLFNNTEITTVPPIDAPAPRKKFGWLPLLIVLFCISYGLMTMLIVEQGATIESQRILIRELFRDSRELAAARQRLQQGAASTESPSSKTQAPVTQNPSSQNPSTQAPAKQAPSSQAAPQRRAQSETEKQRPQFKMPSRPASDLADDRRALITI